MKQLISSATFLAILAAGYVVPAAAAEPAAKQKIRVLLTTGGHGFQQEPFYAMFDAMEDIEYTQAVMPDDVGLLKPSLGRKYDCIVMYDMYRQELTPEQQKAITAMCRSGIGVVSLHHNVGAHRNWDGFSKLIGGKYIFGETVRDGKTYQKTPWSHGEDLKITVADTKHPITQGIADFDIHDETYGVFWVSSDVLVLLTTDHPKNNREVAWTTRSGKSPVFYLMLGHDGAAYGNPNFSKVL